MLFTQQAFPYDVFLLTPFDILDCYYLRSTPGVAYKIVLQKKRMQCCFVAF